MRVSAYSFVLVILIGLASPRAAQPASSLSALHTIVAATTGPIFVLRDSNRIPLRVVKEDTALIVINVDGEWHNIEFQGPDLGRRVGHIQQKYLQSLVPYAVRAACRLFKN